MLWCQCREFALFARVFIAESLVNVGPLGLCRTHVRGHGECGPGRVPDRGHRAAGQASRPSSGAPATTGSPTSPPRWTPWPSSSTAPGSAWSRKPRRAGAWPSPTQPPRRTGCWCTCSHVEPGDAARTVDLARRCALPKNQVMSAAVAAGTLTVRKAMTALRQLGQVEHALQPGKREAALASLTLMALVGADRSLERGETALRSLSSLKL